MSRHPRALAALPILLALVAPGCVDRTLQPIVPCTFSGVVEAGVGDRLEEIDLLFLVDNSFSMSEEREALRAEIPRLVDILASGDRGTGDPADVFEPVGSIHVGVITSDLGISGVPISAGARCDTPSGDDGLLLTEARGGDATCDDAYPPFLRFDRASISPEAYRTPSEYAAAVGCLANTGADGCAFEQQLDAILKALTPSSSSLRFGAEAGSDAPTPGLLGHGDGANDGFLRANSLLVVIALTDEDDCSTPDADLFDVQTTDGSNEYPVPTIATPSGVQAAPNLQCATHRDANHPIARYVDGLLALRPGLEHRLIFATIAGVDPDLVAAHSTPRSRNGATYDAYDYDAILADATMRERVNGTGDNLEPACTRPNPSAPSDRALDNIAYPARRMLGVARGIDARGGTGVVASICQAADAAAGDYRADFSGAIDAIVAAIASNFRTRCLPRPLIRNSTNAVTCEVVETLPPGASCADQPGRELREVDGEREVCEVLQLVPRPEDVAAGVAPIGEGWFYDDYSAELFDLCREPGQQQNIRFTIGAEPTGGATYRIECLNPIPPPSGTVDIGTSCEGDATRCELTGESLEALRSRYARPNAQLACADLSNTCQLRCESDLDCPGGTVCFDGERGNPSAQAFCVSPTC